MPLRSGRKTGLFSVWNAGGTNHAALTQWFGQCHWRLSAAHLLEKWLGMSWGAMSGLPNGERLVIDDTSNMTPSLLRARHGVTAVKWVRRDWLLWITFNWCAVLNRKTGHREIKVKFPVVWKHWRKNSACPVAALSQLNRQLEQRVQISARQTGIYGIPARWNRMRIWFYFCTAMRVYHEHSPDKGVAEIIIGKQRQDRWGRWKCSLTGCIHVSVIFPQGYYF